MKIILTDISGEEKVIENFQKIVLSEEEGVPAHTLLVRYDYDDNLINEIAFIRLENQGKILFDGIADTITEYYSGKNCYIEVFGRNRVSLLIDNEVKPAVYNNPTSEQISQIFLKPYGFGGYIGETAVYNGIFNVSKGKSPWDIIESFTKSCYGTIPYCSPDNNVFFTGLTSRGKITFGKGFEFDFYEYRTDIRRYKIISSVALKRNETDDYSTEVFSQEAEKRSILRKRYLNTSNTQFIPIYCGEKMLQNGINDSILISLKCPCLLTDCLGYEALVNIRGKAVEELIVCSLKAVITNDELYTVVELRGNRTYVDN